VRGQLKGGNVDTEFSNEYCRYTFSEDEKKEIASDMAQKVGELQRLEDELKAVKSDFKSQIDRVQAEVNNSATKINNGYEMRLIKCEVVKDYTKMTIRYIRTDTQETTKERKLTEDERQMRIDE